MYSTVSSNFKNECKQDVNAYKRIAKIHVVEDDIDITNDDMLIDFTIEELAYSGDTFIGNSIAKKINLNIINDGSYNLENKEIEVYVGIDYVGDGSNVELVPYGNFIIAKPTNEEVKNTSNYVGYDYMIKAEKPYVEGNITYPISLYNYLSSVCTSLNIELGSSSIPNGNYQVIGNAYTNNESYRQVIEEIARCCGGFAVIGRDNKLYIKTLSVLAEQELSTEDEILIETEDDFLILTEKPQMSASYSDANSENLTPSQYFDDFNTSNSYGPVNKVALALNYNVIGEDTIMQDNDSIAENGIIEIRLSNISFLNSETQRELAIQDLYDTLHNLNYIPFSTNYYGYPYIDSGDIIKLKSVKSGATYYSYALNHTFTYNGGFSGKLEAPALTDVENEYKETTDAKNAIRNTELRVNKIDGEISSIIEEIGDRSEKITSITQDIDTIESKVYSEIDITRDATGNDPLTLYNAMKGYLLELHIYGNNQVFEQLYPSNDLYPSDDLYPMGDSRIHIYTNNKCPDDISNWINGYTGGSNGIEYHVEPYNSSTLVSEYIKINQNFYVSLEDDNYKISGVSFYNSSKEFISKTTIKLVESAVTIPNNTNYIRFEIVNRDYHHNEQDYSNNYPAIIPGEIFDIKPMIAYGSEKQDYAGYNDTTIELGVTDVLRRLVKEDGTVIRDSFDLINGMASITRIVGIDSGGDPYDMEVPVVTDLGELQIPIAEGENYFEIVNYNAECKAKWVIRNNYTNTFATTVELQSSITQLANSINLQVSKKVNNNEVIARINMAILGRDEAEVPDDIEKSIIEILANKISITSDNFSITNNGVATFKQGFISNWSLNDGFLSSNHYEGSTLYQSGLFSRNTSTGTNIFIYSGLDITNGNNYLTNSNFYVANNGLCKAKWFEVNGENGYFYVNYNSGRTALQFTKEGIYWKLDNSANNEFSSMVITANGNYLRLYDSPGFFIRDSIHNQSLLSINRYRPETGVNQAFIELHQKTYYYAGGSTGYEIATRNDICDEKVKKNIKQSNENALDKINKIEFKQFDWDKSKINREGHIDIGITAQQVKEIDENFVDTTTIYSTNNTKNGDDNKSEQELLTINTLNLLTTSMKAIQELSEIVNNQQKKIEALEGEINKLKGENK